jgi:diacylglycerol kinase (ATP)
MHALAILGPGAHHRELIQLRGAGLDVVPAQDAETESAARLMIVLGGDGTIHRFLPAMLSSRLPVLIIPQGSGNDLARALKIRSPAAAIDLARRFVKGERETRSIDLGMITDSSGKETLFSCVGGVGLASQAAAFANRMPRWLRSHGGYLLSACSSLIGHRSFELAVSSPETDGASPVEIKRASCLFSFANTPTFGGGLPIAPDASLHDARLDCILADSMPRLKLVARALSLLRGTHLRSKEVSFFRASTLRIETRPATDVYADGEFVCQTPIEVRLLPAALTFLIGT